MLLAIAGDNPRRSAAAVKLLSSATVQNTRMLISVSIGFPCSATPYYQLIGNDTSTIRPMINARETPNVIGIEPV
jgi:hypothetical protein